MSIYLPIAEVSVNALLLLGLGGLVGVLSGMFGVGGGFLMTPLLFFIGIPPAVAVAGWCAPSTTLVPLVKNPRIQNCSTISPRASVMTVGR